MDQAQGSAAVSRWRSTLFLGVCALLGCDGTPQAPVPEIIDVHVHTTFTNAPEPASGILETQEQLLAEMAEAGVVGAVSHQSLDGSGHVDLSAQGVIHCVTPGVEVDLGRVEGALESRTHRCIKIYLGYVPRFASDPAYEPVYALARQYDVPVVFHTGDTYSSRAKLKYAHPLTIDEVAVDHPDVTFVIAHAGYPWYETAAEVTYKNPNVFIEASAFLVGDVANAPEEWVWTYIVDPIAWIFGYIEDPSKMLFGSDWPLVRISTYAEAYRAAIPQEYWQAVFHDNAVRVFKMRREAVSSER